MKEDGHQAIDYNKQKDIAYQEFKLKSRVSAKFQKVKKQALFKSISFAILFIVIAFVVRSLVYTLHLEHIAIYIQLAEIGILGYFSIRIVSELVTKLLNGHSENHARSVTSIVRIGGLLIILAIVITMLANDPYVTIAITTIVGIALAISVQSVIGNVVAGLVLAIIRPFKIGDSITVFGITGSVRDIGLLYVYLTTNQDKKTMLVPNGIMLGTAIVKEKSMY